MEKMLNTFDLLHRGLSLLVHRHQKMEFAGLAPDPAPLAIMEMSCRLLDAPTDETLLAAAQSLLAKHGVAEQTIHAAYCRDLFTSGLVEETLNYCAAQRVKPPKCPIEVESVADRKAQDRAGDVISDPKWWEQQIRDRERKRRR
jgi:hypothetical protein